MTLLSSSFPPLVTLNHDSFHDPRVTVVNGDAMPWLENSHDKYDSVIIDFPDPNNFALGKLYTTRFYRVLAQHLSPRRVSRGAVHFTPVRAHFLLVRSDHVGSCGL
jgi:spermidine synthase